jgi:UDP-N-acetylmuramoyl-L-alanyl-D-glutamate--2,6-diaminopimelate ligase
VNVILGELLAGLPVDGDYPQGLEVHGIQHDSRRVQDGELFVAIPGASFDGRNFAPEAVARGAVAVLAAGPAPSPLSVPWLLAAEPRRLLATLSARFYGRPDRELLMVGVTGTNGKTTTTWILQAILEVAGLPTGRIGTLGYLFRGLELPAQRTTPEASDLYRILRAMRGAGAEAAVMEVSSHALALHRVSEMEFRVAAFTNLTRDHLDYHAGMEDYFAAKRQLFDLLALAGVAVINGDDPWGQQLAGALPRVLTFGERGDVRPVSAQLDDRGIRAEVATPRGPMALESSLRGGFNLSNLLAAVACAEALELPGEAIAEGIRRLGPVPGRLEPVEVGQPFPVFVDYAHTEDGLARAIRAVREVTGNKVVVVFGCGGDRDRGKRRPMGRVAGELADLVVLTSDNPRSEDPLAILAAVEEGVQESGNPNYRLLPDRRDAIRRALAVAGPGWAVLVAGKGSESGQEIAGEIRRFSDREEIIKALEEWHGVRDSC